MPASSTHRQPTARDIPPVTLTNITHVDPAEFRPYLSQVGALYDALQRAKENEDEDTLRLLRKGSQVDSFEDLLDKSLRQSARTPTGSRKASIASLASLLCCRILHLQGDDLVEELEGELHRRQRLFLQYLACTLRMISISKTLELSMSSVSDRKLYDRFLGRLTRILMEIR